MSVTIYDVANKAGVSISTVSRVLNKNPNVLEETRQKVLKIIEELEFKPNPIARGLVVNQTNLIQVFFSWFETKCDFKAHWYVELLNGINETVQENDFGLLVNTIAGVFDPVEIYKKMFHNAMDGILLVSPILSEKDILHITENKVPIVLIGHRTESPDIDFVDCDNLNASAQMVDYLVGLGHKKIAFIAGPVKMSSDAMDRLTGYKNAMKKHGLNIPENYIVEGSFTRVSGTAAAKKLLALSDRPTAIFSSDDLMALATWDEIEKAGLKVGKDIALVGFDDIAEASKPPYSLTTMKQDFRGLSVEATKILIEKIHHLDTWKTRQVFMPTLLVVRESSGVKK